MIVVESSDNKIVATGHAGYDVEGRDIVCAGFSALVYTLIESIQRLTNTKIDATVKSGYTKIELPNNISKECKLIVESFLLGVEMMAESYPQYIKLTEMSLN